MKGRHSITKALASSRGTRTLIVQAEIRYAKSELIARRLTLALAYANAAEVQLRDALRQALDKSGRSKARAA